MKYGAPRDTDHPELRQPLASEIWESTLKSLGSGSKITLLTTGPLTNLAKLILSDKNVTSLIEVSGFTDFSNVNTRTGKQNGYQCKQASQRINTNDHEGKQWPCER